MSGAVFDPLRLGSVAMDVLSSGRAAAQALHLRQKARLAALMAAAQQRSSVVLHSVWNLSVSWHG